jgi:Skp family chaperone for outer membrane proteins
MSKPCRWTIVLVVAMLSGVVACIAAAQNAAPSPAVRTAGTVALLDVKCVLENHPRLKAQKAELKAALDRVAAESQGQKKTILQVGERLKDFREGTPEYKQLETDLAKRQAEFAANRQLQGRDLARKEARMWHDAYQELCDVTSRYAQQHGIAAVIQFANDPVDPDKSESVLQYMSRPVVAYRTDLDITQAILQELTRSDANRAVPGQRPRTAVPQPSR